MPAQLPVAGPAVFEAKGWTRWLNYRCLHQRHLRSGLNHPMGNSRDRTYRQLGTSQNPHQLLPTAAALGEEGGFCSHGHEKRLLRSCRVTRQGNNIHPFICQWPPNLQNPKSWRSAGQTAQESSRAHNLQAPAFADRQLRRQYKQASLIERRPMRCDWHAAALLMGARL